MSLSGQLLPPYLKPAAFEAVQEIKEDKESPYGPGILCIEKYPKTAWLERSKKPFQDQFNQLLEKYTAWGLAKNLYTPHIDEQITLMKDQFFHHGYAGDQDATYFENIKKYLEKIFLILQNDEVAFVKRENAYNKLCNNLGRCAPGLDVHIENAYFSLYSTLSISLTNWIAALRSKLIRYYADKYNHQHRIPPGNSIHTIKPLSDYATKQNWNPTFSTENIIDKYAPVLTKEDLIDFHQYFVDEFNAKTIRDCIQVNLYIEINNLFKSLGFLTDGEWRDSGHLNYKVFTDRASYLLNTLGVQCKDGIFDFLDNTDDYAQFRICEDSIVSMLSERVLSSALYFDPVKKSIINLFPPTGLTLNIL